ncbi:hypothetical protein FQA39_LY04907 [Lamprigera yunnana]|nr:hypothetical protein FQA39_LY04907 [Lamprigera yunnana]
MVEVKEQACNNNRQIDGICKGVAEQKNKFVDVEANENREERIQAYEYLKNQNIEIVNYVKNRIECGICMGDDENVELDKGNTISEEIYDEEKESNKKKGDTEAYKCDEKYRRIVQQLLKEFEKLTNEEHGLARHYVHHLEVYDKTPFKYKKKVKAEVESMLRGSIIERAKTCYINPIVMVKKGNDEIGCA